VKTVEPKHATYVTDVMLSCQKYGYGNCVKKTRHLVPAAPLSALIHEAYVLVTSVRHCFTFYSHWLRQRRRWCFCCRICVRLRSG